MPYSYAVKDMMVMIPVGGRAQRLLPLTAETSKACLRLLNRPLIEFSILALARQGIRNFIFGVKGYRNYRDLYDYFESGYGLSARYSISPRVHIKYQPNVDDLGSADSVRINMDYYHVRNPVFVVQGDNIFDINLKELVNFHHEKEAFVTIALIEVKDVGGFGIAELSGDNRIKRFVEKPKPEEAPSRLANAGLYLLSPEVRKVFRENGVRRIMKERNRLDFGYDFIPYIVKTGRPVYGYVMNGVWYDVGTPSRYLEAMRGLLDGKCSYLVDFGGRVCDDARIWIQGESPEAKRRRREIITKIKSGRICVQGSVLIGRHCRIEDGASIINSCIDNYTKIERGAVIENSAVMDRSIIGEKAEIRDSIIGRHVKVKSSCLKPAKIVSVSVVADDVVIEAGSSLNATKIYPHQHVEGEFENQTLFLK